MKGPSKPSAFTLLEILLSMAIIGVAGVILYSLLHGVSVLSVKNSAINLGHQQVRRMVHRAVDEIRESASAPQLIDSNLTPLNGATANGPAAGVSYQAITGGPYRVWNNTVANSPNIRITTRDGDPPPEPGMRLIIPAFQIEADIAGVGGFPGSPQVRDIRLTTNVGVNIACNAGEPVYTAYFTRRRGMVVVDGELRHYDNLASTEYRVSTRNLKTGKPFEILATDRRFIKVSLTAGDPRVTQRGYNAVDVSLTLTVPFRYALTTRQ